MHVSVYPEDDRVLVKNGFASDGKEEASFFSSLVIFLRIPLFNSSQV
jgi:hypothetical protein